MFRLKCILLLLLIAPLMLADFSYPYTCKDDDRKALCSNDSNIVCGWFFVSMVQCFNYPCASEYSNPCIACKDVRVQQLYQGSCPKVK